MAANAADVRETAPPGGPPFSLESLLQALREFAIAVDRDGFIRTIWSPILLHSHDPKALLLGRPLGEVLDQQTYDRFTDLSRRPDDVGRSRTIECTVGFADGVRCFAVRALTVANGTGEPEALWLLAFDISHRKRAMEDLQKSETLLVQAEELANIGSFEVNLETKEVVWSPQLCRALQ
ncbi:MAG TPA: hypothetical protein VNM68_02615, partial [Candidatus Polarisedimenticolia bacterium]|nr:hypothetical protein [Candidatus Polarisedimenticolia bacterium]